MTTSTLTEIDVGGATSAEVEVYTPDDGDAPMVVLNFEQCPMTPVAARRLAAALNQAADQAERR
jgi:hypothetical protein